MVKVRGWLKQRFVVTNEVKLQLVEERRSCSEGRWFWPSHELPMRLQCLCALSAAAVITLAFVAGANTTASVPPDVDAVLQHIDDLYRSKTWGCCCVDGVVGRTPQRVCAGREANPTVATDQASVLLLSNQTVRDHEVSLRKTLQAVKGIVCVATKYRGPDGPLATTGPRTTAHRRLIETRRRCDLPGPFMSTEDPESKDFFAVIRMEIQR